MQTGDFIITRMREFHLREVFETAQENNLSYWSPEDYRAEILKKDSCCLIAENDKQEVTGFLVARLIMTENCAELYNIAVRDQYRRNGIGGNLLSHLINRCVINKLHRINLEVRESNRIAASLYSKLGFRTAGLRKNFYTQPTEHAVTMIKYLDN